MTQCDPTDLLCSSRREELTLDEQRRLRDSLQYSFEVRLMSQILPELEKQSRVRPGDDVLLARINARALTALRVRAAPSKAHAKRRAVMLLVAVAVLLVAGLAGAWFGEARPRLIPAPAPAPALTTIDGEKKLKKPRNVAPRAVVNAGDAPEASEPSQPAPSAPLPSAREASSSNPSAASELFIRANALRRQGRASEAAVLYELLLARYPQSREVGPSRLALAKYFQASQPERAFAQLSALASSGGALRAEALWGLSEVASALGRRSVSEQALADLRREFPASPYADVARDQAAP